MHFSAYEHGRLFFELYWRPEFSEIVDLGAMNVNGTLRDHCPAGARYIGLDMEAGPGVDIVVTPGQPVPIADSSVDVAVTNSAFEHDVCFWETFLDLIRILRPGGLLYVNAPSNYAFHRYPVDCWRFYPDAGHALQVWAARRGIAVELLESFVAKPAGDGWADFIAVFRKPSDRPFERKGRIADHTEAMNIHDIRLAGPGQIEAENPATWDMLETSAVKGELDAAKSEILALQAQVAALKERAASIEAERSALERDLQEIRGSTAWRLVSPVLGRARR